MRNLSMIILSGDYSLCKLPAGSHLPAWIFSSAFYNINNSSDELSVVCESKFVPAFIQQDANWKLIKIAEVLDLSLTGITANFSTALANAGVNICVMATFNTDYIMVKSIQLPQAMAALENVGFTFKASKNTE